MHLDKIDGIVPLSISRLAIEFSSTRETVSKKLQAANVVPHSKRQGYPVYRVRDAAAALLEIGGGYDTEGNPDPLRLPPEKRRAWYQSEVQRLKVGVETGQLIYAAEVEATMADLIKSLVQFLDTLPDVMERNAALTPAQVDALNETIDQQRQAFYLRMASEETEAQTA